MSKMTKEQAEVLNIVQEVLRGVVISVGAVAPEKLAELSASLQAFASAPGISPTSAGMLKDLAEGPGMFATLGQKRQ